MVKHMAERKEYFTVPLCERPKKLRDINLKTLLWWMGREGVFEKDQAKQSERKEVGGRRMH